MLRSPNSDDLELKHIQNETINIVIQVLNEYGLGRSKLYTPHEGYEVFCTALLHLSRKRIWSPHDLDVSLLMLVDIF